MAKSHALPMLVLSSRAAAMALADRGLSERRIAILIVVAEVFLTASGYYGLYNGQTINWTFYAEALGVLTITAAGIWYCYLRNGGDGSRQFAEKFLVLSTPIAWKLAVLNWPGFFLASYLVTRATVNTSDETFEVILSLLDVGWSVSIAALFFLRLGHWMRWSRLKEIQVHADSDRAMMK